MFSPRFYKPRWPPSEAVPSGMVCEGLYPQPTPRALESAVSLEDGTWPILVT